MRVVKVYICKRGGNLNYSILDKDQISADIRFIEKNPNIAILQIRCGYMKPFTQITVFSNFEDL